MVENTSLRTRFIEPLLIPRRQSKPLVQPIRPSSTSTPTISQSSSDIEIQAALNDPNAKVKRDSSGNIVSIETGRINATNRDNDGNTTPVTFAAKKIFVKDGSITKVEDYDVFDADPTRAVNQKRFAKTITEYSGGEPTIRSGYERRNQSIKRTFIRDLRTGEEDEFGSVKRTPGLKTEEQLQQERLESQEKLATFRSQQPKPSIAIDGVAIPQEFITAGVPLDASRIRIERQEIPLETTTQTEREKTLLEVNLEKAGFDIGRDTRGVITARRGDDIVSIAGEGSLIVRGAPTAKISLGFEKQLGTGQPGNTFEQVINKIGQSSTARIFKEGNEFASKVFKDFGKGRKKADIAIRRTKIPFTNVEIRDIFRESKAGFVDVAKWVEGREIAAGKGRSIVAPTLKFLGGIPGTIQKEPTLVPLSVATGFALGAPVKALSLTKVGAPIVKFGGIALSGLYATSVTQRVIAAPTGQSKADILAKETLRLAGFQAGARLSIKAFETTEIDITSTTTQPVTRRLSKVVGGRKIATRGDGLKLKRLRFKKVIESSGTQAQPVTIERGTITTRLLGTKQVQKLTSVSIGGRTTGSILGSRQDIFFKITPKGRVTSKIFSKSGKLLGIRTTQATENILGKFKFKKADTFKTTKAQKEVIKLGGKDGGAEFFDKVISKATRTGRIAGEKTQTGVLREITAIFKGKVTATTRQFDRALPQVERVVEFPTGRTLSFVQRPPTIEFSPKPTFKPNVREFLAVDLQAAGGQAAIRVVQRPPLFTERFGGGVTTSRIKFVEESIISRRILEGLNIFNLQKLGKRGSLGSLNVQNLLRPSGVVVQTEAPSVSTTETLLSTKLTLPTIKPIIFQAPTLIPVLIPQTITRPTTRIKPTTRVRNITRPVTKVQPVTKVIPEIQVRPVTRVQPRTRTITRSKIISKTLAPTPIGLGLGTPIATPIFTKIPLPIIPKLPELDIGFGLKRTKKKRKQKRTFKFQPQLIAVAKNIKGKRNKVLTGVAIERFLK